MSLVITRKTGESVDIGAATVTVAKSGAGGVKLVIDATPEVKILRSELRDVPDPKKGTDDGERRDGS